MRDRKEIKDEQEERTFSDPDIFIIRNTGLCLEVLLDIRDLLEEQKIKV